MIDIKTLGEVFENSTERVPDRLALKNLDTEYTYAQLKNRVLRVKDHLRELDMEKGDRFAVVGENRPEWAISYLAILRAGMVVVPLDPLLSEGETLHILRESEARGVFASETHRDKIESIKGELKNLKHIIPQNEVHRLSGSREYPVEPIDPDSLAVLIFTSGTTGTSKAVMLSHTNIISNLKAIMQVIPLDERDTLVSIIPIHHTFEATAGFLYPLFCGAGIYYTPSLKPNDLIATFKEARISCMVAVPILFEKLLNGVYRKVAGAPLPTKIVFGTISGIGSVFNFLRKPLFSSVRRELGLDQLRIAISGGAALPAKVSSGLALFGIPISQGYGLTESSPVLTVNPLGRSRNASVGLALPGIEIRINEPDDQGIGEIVARGPNVMMGYANNPTATAEVLKDGWLYTGDMGYLDKDGYLYITGRKKSLIVTQTGKNIYPEEIEERLIKSEWIKEVLVIPRVDVKTKKEEVCALIVPDYERLEAHSISKNVKLSAQDVQAIFLTEIKTVNEQLPAYKRVTRFEIREEEFPKTTTQKIKRHMFVDRGIRVN